MASGFTLQMIVSQYLKHYDYSLVPFFYSSITYTNISVTSIGYLVVSFNSTDTQYLMSVAAFVLFINIGFYLFKLFVTKQIISGEQTKQREQYKKNKGPHSKNCGKQSKGRNTLSFHSSLFFCVSPPFSPLSHPN